MPVGEHCTAIYVIMTLLWFRQQDQQLCRLFHLLHGSVFVAPVEVVPAGAHVGAGNAHLGESGAVGTAADRQDDRFHAELLHSFLGAGDQVHVVLERNSHVVVLVADREL